MTENVVTQRLRDFTVRIVHADSESIVGTGIVVTTDGKVVTCAHVVKSAGLEPRLLNDKELGVYFPQAQAGERKDRRAKVIAFFPDFDDDVVLLQLTDGSAPLGPELMPVLGTAEKSQDNPFRSYGYRRLEDYVAGWVHGTIRGHVDAPSKRKLQGEPVQLESNQINRGMSGSAVLDIDRNLVVGIISETWFPDKTGKDRDTGWAVDSRVLSLAPLVLTVQDAPLALKPAPQPKADEQTKQLVIEAAQDTVSERSIRERYSWNDAPSVLTEWIGRDHLLARITEDWNDPTKHVTGLIGFGGEGKSSLARKWVDTLLTGDSLPIFSEKKGEPSSLRSEGASHGSGMGVDGVFWWGFYENRSVDEFLEAALKYMSGGKIDPRKVQSSNTRAQIIGAMLGAGRYLFVLDGLEVMQHQEGDQYGLLQSNDLRDLLTFFARPGNQSFCLITSRAPLLDLMDYTTYTHRDVDRLSDKDGYDLLVKLGVNGTKQQLDEIVFDWNGHALTLSLIGSYLVNQHNGDATKASDFELVEDPDADNSTAKQYKHVGRILRRYDDHLTKEEKAFLILFSAFRIPVHISALKKVFKTKTDTTAWNAPLTNLYDDEFTRLVQRLINYRILRFDEKSQTYTTHPLIHSHYAALFTKGNPSQEKATHNQIKNYYLSIAGSTPEHPTLDDLKPFIEAVYHACKADAFDEALTVYAFRIQQRPNRYVLTKELGSYETNLDLLYQFFPNRVIEQGPRLRNTRDKLWILNDIGYCLMSLGRLQKALPFFENYVTGSNEIHDWVNVSAAYQNLTDLHAALGALKVSAGTADEGIKFAHLSKDKVLEKQMLAWQGRLAYMHGEIGTADDCFVRAERMEQEMYSSQKILYLISVRGVHHAIFLHRIGQSNYARNITEANLQICEQNHWAYSPGMCHRVLGELDADLGDHDSARVHYDAALNRARSEAHRGALIEALLARGLWFAKHMKDISAAFSDLDEAFGYCVESGYRIYEADVRIALGWAYLAKGEKYKASQSVERARQMSNEMGYHWGKVDAEEVLERINAEG